MEIDLDRPQFTLAQAVLIVPGLTVDMVQNWDKRKVLSEETAARAKKNAHIRWTLRHLIIMRMLVDAGRFGFKPSLGVSIARIVAREADAFVNSHKFGGSQRNGVSQYLFNADVLNTYRRAIIHSIDGADVINFSVQMLKADAASENSFRMITMSGVYLTLEADFIFADTINAALFVQAGFDPQIEYSSDVGD